MRAGVLSRGLGTGPQRKPATRRWGGAARPTSGPHCGQRGHACCVHLMFQQSGLGRSPAPRGPKCTAQAQPLDPQAPHESGKASPCTGPSVPSRAQGVEASAAPVLGVGGPCPEWSTVLSPHLAEGNGYQPRTPGPKRHNWMGMRALSSPQPSGFQAPSHVGTHLHMQGTCAFTLSQFHVLVRTHPPTHTPTGTARMESKQASRDQWAGQASEPRSSPASCAVRPSHAPDGTFLWSHCSFASGH